MMICTIEWNTLSIPEWEQKYKTITRANVLQSYDYACAIAPLNHQKPRWGLIKIDGHEAGLVQILEAGLFKNRIHAVILDRGPLWFHEYGTLEHCDAFIKAYNKEFPRRPGRKRRFIPEIQASDEITQRLTAHGFTRQPAPGYQTLWLDLREDPETLRQNLKKNWRGTLNKAEKENLTLEWDEQGAHLDWLLQNYAVDRAAKGYDGPSVKLIRAMAKTFTPGKNMLIGRALSKGDPIAGILILCHGAGATYQIGFSQAEGRNKGAHHLLLWNALLVLKQKGIHDFDLGGVNDETAKGVKDFKTGMGAKLFYTAGLYH